MRGLAGEQLLRAWECSREMPEQQAALALLEFAEPERPAREWARLPLARRDALLLELRAATLGRRIREDHDGGEVTRRCGQEQRDPGTISRKIGKILAKVVLLRGIRLEFRSFVVKNATTKKTTLRIESRPIVS